MEKLKEFLLYPLLLMATVITLYHSVVNNEFSGLDDILMIEDHWDNLSEIGHIYTAFTDDVFAKEVGTYYRPIQVLSYMPEAFLSQTPNPNWKMYFLGNILLFMSSILLLYFFLKTLGFSTGFRFIFSFFVAIHPVLVPSVAWIPGRVDLVLFLLVLGAIWSFIQYLNSKKIIWLLSHYLLFALGMFTKETTIVVPMVVLIYGLNALNVFSTSTQWTWKSLIRVAFWKGLITESFKWILDHYKIIMGWLIILLIWFILRKNALPDSEFGIYGFIKGIALSWQDFIVLIGSIVFPYNLQVFLDFSWVYLLYSIPGLLLLYWIIRTEKLPFNDFIVGFFCIILFILPTVLSDYINYHRLLIPLVGMAFILKPLDTKISRKIQVTLVFFATFFLYENIQFQKAFTTKTKFWRNAAEYNQNTAFAFSGLAWSYHVDKNVDSAYYYYQEVLRCDSTKVNARMGMAIIAEEWGNTETADSLLLEELKVTKDSNYVHYYIGQVLLERGDTIRAIKNLQKGYPITGYLRNARQYYDTLDIKVKNKLDFNLN